MCFCYITQITSYLERKNRFISKLTISSKRLDMESVSVGHSVWCHVCLYTSQYAVAHVWYYSFVMTFYHRCSLLKVVVFVSQSWTIINHLWISVCLTQNTEMECHLNYLSNYLYWTTKQRCSDTNRKKNIIFYNLFRRSDILRDMPHQFSLRL